MTVKIELTEAPLFADCSKKEKRLVRSRATQISVPAGRALTEQGSVGLEFGVIVEGVAGVYIDDERVADLGPGDFYGELALLDASGNGRGTRIANVKAETDVTVDVMSVLEFRAIIAELPGVRGAIEQIAAARRARNANNPRPSR